MLINAPAERQGLIFAYKMRRDTASRLRFLSVTYVYVRSHQGSRALLVWLAFSYGKVVPTKYTQFGASLSVVYVSVHSFETSLDLGVFSCGKRGTPI